MRLVPAPPQFSHSIHASSLASSFLRFAIATSELCVGEDTHLQLVRDDWRGSSLSTLLTGRELAHQIPWWIGSDQLNMQRTHASVSLDR